MSFTDPHNVNYKVLCNVNFKTNQSQNILKTNLSNSVSITSASSKITSTFLHILTKFTFNMKKYNPYQPL